LRAYDIIYKKREGKSLSAEEIKYLIDAYVKGDVPDYQMSAWAMAVFFQGMNKEEIAHLTMFMAESGERIDFSFLEGINVDKHSTGGVGDKTSLVLVPLVAAAGVKMPKMSGRGLGHTGGTIDKLESIPGFKTNLSRDEFLENINNHGAAIIAQSGNLTPADKKLYALRDVTATIDSIPLIASSIMSKKIAAGAKGVVLDVKTGSGAFMQEREKSKELARAMVDIGKQLKLKTIAVITNMEQPLGKYVGNALEVKEAILTLKGKGSKDLKELSLTLAAELMIISGKTNDFNKAYKMVEEILDSGRALQKFADIIAAQHGDARVIENLSLLPEAKIIYEIKSNKDGYVKKIDAREIGLIAMNIGAGRETKNNNIDPAVGVVLNKKVGDKVDSGDVLAELHLNNELLRNEAAERLKRAFIISKKPAHKNELIYDIID